MSSGAHLGGFYDHFMDMKFVLWWTIAWSVAIMALAPLVNFVTPLLSSSYNEALTPDFFYRLIVYWHGGMFEPWVVVLSVLVYISFGLNSLTGFVGKGLRVLLYAGAFIGVPLSGIASIFNVSSSFAFGIPHWSESAGFSFMDLLAIGVIVGLLLYPHASKKGYAKMSAPYYFVLVGVIGAFAAALMGYVGAYLTAFGDSPPLVQNYINATMYPSLGFYNSTAISIFTENALGSHSHAMLPILMGGVVALLAMVYGYQSWPRREKLLGSFGFGVMVIGVIASVWIYAVAGIGNFAIPSLFVSGPNGLNNIAADDLVTGVIGLGAVFVLIPLLVNASKGKTQDGKPLTRDPLFLSVITGWIMIYVVIPISGYYVELNNEFYLGAGSAFGDAFTRFHQDFAFFLLPALVTTVLVFESFGIRGKARRTTGFLYLAGEVVAFVFGVVYALGTLDPMYLYVAAFGGALMGLGVIFGVNSLRKSGTPTAVANFA